MSNRKTMFIADTMIYVARHGNSFTTPVPDINNMISVQVDVFEMSTAHKKDGYDYTGLYDPRRCLYKEAMVIIPANTPSITTDDNDDKVEDNDDEDDE